MSGNEESARVKPTRDISDEDLETALAAQANSQLLSRLVELSRSTFGFYTCLYPHTINYPWVVERLESLNAGSRILDIGAGVSPVPLYLAEKGLLLDCVDHSAHVRTLPFTLNCNEWGFFDYSVVSSNIVAHHCDIAQFHPTHTYDAIYSIASLAHMPRATRDKALQRCYDWLRAPGLLLLTIDLIPASDFIWNRTEGKEVESPIQHGTIFGLTDYLSSAGFVIDECQVQRTVYKSRTDLLYIAARKP